jgi:hypothetical protein
MHADIYPEHRSRRIAPHPRFHVERELIAELHAEIGHLPSRLIEPLLRFLKLSLDLVAGRLRRRVGRSHLRD